MGCEHGMKQVRVGRGAGSMFNRQVKTQEVGGTSKVTSWQNELVVLALRVLAWFQPCVSST